MSVEDRVAEVLARIERDPKADVAALLAALPPEERDACREALATREALSRFARSERAEFSDDDAPPRIPGFLVESRIGRGGLGTVWAAWDQSLHRRVALKVLRRETGSREREREREGILDEARKAAALRHPGIVTVHQIAEGEGGAAAIVMEIVEGQPLDRAAAALDFRAKARLLESVARALSAAHAHGIVHRDLKPENVLVTAALEPKVLDFGLAIRAGGAAVGAASSDRGRFVGTPLWASPEQAAMSGDVGPASDVFSFGAVMFAVLTGRPPFDGRTPTEVLGKIRSAEPPFPRTLSPKFPEDLQAICLACLAREPKDRPSALDVADDLARAIAGEPARLRPALYRDLLRRRAAEHVRDVRDWEGQGIVSPAEADRLAVVYRRILADEDHWIFDARRLSLPQVALYTGTWMVVVATLLLVWFARDDLAPWGRVVLPLGSCAILLALGAVARARREIVGTASFVTGLVLAAAPAAVSLFSETGLLALRPEGVEQILPAPYTNEQVFAALSISLALSLGALALLRMTAFAWSTASLLAAAWIAFLVTRGWIELEPQEAALRLLPLVALVVPALAFESRGRVRWAIPFHVIALVALVLLPDVMAQEGWPLRELFGLDRAALPDDRGTAYALAGNGLVFLGAMLLCERSTSLDLRRAARMLEFLVPMHVVGALYAVAADEARWGDLAALLGAVALLLALGPRRSRHRFLLGGLSGVALASHVLLERYGVPPVPFGLGLGLAGLAIAGVTFAILTRRR